MEKRHVQFTLYLKMINICTHIPTCLSEPCIPNIAKKPTNTHAEMRVCLCLVESVYKLRSHKYTSGSVFFSELRDADVFIHTSSQPRGHSCCQAPPLSPSQGCSRGREHNWGDKNRLQRPDFIADYFIIQTGKSSHTIVAFGIRRNKHG